MTTSKIVSMLVPGLVVSHSVNGGPEVGGHATGSKHKFVEKDNRYYLNDPNFKYWNDTKDDILTEFKTMMIIAEHNNMYNGQQDTVLRSLQRFAELVDMIMYLQKVPFFGQYWYYGCWCTPEGFLSTNSNGFGNPVDPIDKSCKFMSQCYECTKIDFGQECSSDLVNYRWHGDIDKEGRKEVFCDDHEGTCERAICECDRKLAYDLSEHEKEWDLHKHQKWGEFNRELKCDKQSDRYSSTAKKVIGEKTLEAIKEAQKPVSVKELSRSANPQILGTMESQTTGEQDIWARAYGEGVLSQLTPDMNIFADMPSLNLKSSFDLDGKQCCGDYPQRYPFKAKTNAKANCCKGKHIYNILNQDCCDNGEVRDNGQCPL